MSQILIEGHKLAQFNVCSYQQFLFLKIFGKPYYWQRWARATSKVAPLPLPLLALKSSVATATRYSSSKIARYRYFSTKVAALPATLNNL